MVIQPPILMFVRSLSVLCFLCVGQSAAAQSDRPSFPLPEPSVEIMLVGSFHFAQADTVRFDVLEPEHQAEVADAVRSLAQFQPTKVMVERQPNFWQRRIDSTYAEYRAGRVPRLPRNEMYQIGYRLADAAGLDRVWAIDHAGYWLGDTLRTVAAQMNQEDLVDWTAPFTYPNPFDSALYDSLLTHHSLADVLGLMNSPSFQALMYDGYVNSFARVGIVEGDDFDEQDNEVGGDLVAEWVRRNIKIYREILARTSYEPGDRLVIIGAGHVAPMRQFFEANLNFRVVEVSDYL